MNQRHPLTAAAQPSLALRLRGLSRTVRGLVLLAAPILASIPVLLLVKPEWLPDLGLGLGQASGLHLSYLAQGGVTLAARMRLAAAGLPTVIVGLASLWQLWSLFGEYLRGAVFSAHALACLRRFGALLVALAIVQPLSQALMSVAISWDNPPGERMLLVAISSSDYALVIGALVFLAIARVMTEAARVAEENESFV